MCKICNSLRKELGDILRPDLLRPIFPSRITYRNPEYTYRPIYTNKIKKDLHGQEEQV